MKNVIRYYISDNKDGEFIPYPHDELNNFKPFDMAIVSNTFASYTSDEEIARMEKRYHLDFDALIKHEKEFCPAPQSLHLCGIRTVEEVIEILAIVKESLTSLYLFKCPDLDDLSFLENLSHLQELNIYWNRKATRLFDAARIPNLKKFYMTNCNNIVDFEGLKHSNIECLALYGCDCLSSFTPKLDVGDMDFLEYMPHLKTLYLDIMRTRADDVYLKAIAKAKNLEEFNIGERFFTFEQFAWLSAHLPNVKEDLEPCKCYNSQNECVTIVEETDDYSIIGRRKTYAKKPLAIRYLNAYNALRKKFIDAPEPPSSNFKCSL